jgi:hypothetical protein
VVVAAGEVVLVVHYGIRGIPYVAVGRFHIWKPS